MGALLLIGVAGIMLSRGPTPSATEDPTSVTSTPDAPTPTTDSGAATTESTPPAEETPAVTEAPPAGAEEPAPAATEAPPAAAEEPAPAVTEAPPSAATEEPAPAVTEAPPPVAETPATPEAPETASKSLVVHDAPHVRVEAERGSITVHWEVSPLTSHVVCAFEVMRREADGSWAVVHETMEGRSFVDEQVKPRTDYTYKVVSNANVDPNDPVVRRHRLTLPPERARLESLEVGPVQTLPDIYVVPVTVSPRAADAPDDAPPGYAFVRVYRWDREAMTFQRHAFTVLEGEAVGGPAKLRGGREFDFSTGAVLEEVRLETRKHPTLGHDEQVQVIVLRHPDGQLEVLNDKDLPAGLPN